MSKFYFNKPVLGKSAYAPDGWLEGADGVEFDIKHTEGDPWSSRPTRKGRIKVFVPWSNINFVVREEHWDE